MDQNPYAPPRPLTDPIAGSAAPVTAEKELQVMREIGRRRVRTFSWTFGISWPVSWALLLLVLGFIPAMILGAALAGVFAKYFVKSRKDAIIAAVMSECGVPPGALDPSKYIMD